MIVLILMKKKNVLFKVNYTLYFKECPKDTRTAKKAFD